MRQSQVPKRSPKGGHQSWNPSQIVAHNMAKARELRGFTQTDTAERMSRYTEAKWTKTSVALAEGSVSGSRIRAFTAVELFALARTFDLPVTYFLAPPEDTETVSLDMPGVPPNAWDYLMMLVAGHQDNSEFVGSQFAGFAAKTSVQIPPSDASIEAIESYTTRVSSQFPLNPTDVLASAFHGLMLSRMRGAPPAAGDTLESWISVLDDLKDALRSFQIYEPGRFVNPQIAQEIARKREQALDRDRERRQEEVDVIRLRGQEQLRNERLAAEEESREREQEDQ